MAPHNNHDTAPLRSTRDLTRRAAAFDDDTAPHPAVRPAGSATGTPGAMHQASRLAVYLLSAVAALAVLGVALWLLLPPLLSPAPDEQPGYGFLSVEDAVSGLAAPSGDLLLETADHQVSLFVPQGALTQDTILVLQPRDPSQTPDVATSAVERRLPVDVYGTTPSGEVLLIVALKRPALLCFRPGQEVEDLAAQGSVTLAVQRYDDLLNSQEWIDLPVVPGWEPQQICAQTDHFSLFALGLHLATTAVSHSLVTATPTALAGPIDIYSALTATP